MELYNTIVCLLMLLVGCVLGSAIKESRQAPEQPTYTVEQDFDGELEHRRYNKFTVAASTTPGCMSFKWAQSVGYYHVSGYVRRGQNSEQRPLSMGVPVFVKVDRVKDLEQRCTEIYTTEFVISANQSPKDLPQPTSDRVTLRSVEGDFYVSVFNGEMGEPRDRVLDLRRQLNYRNLCYDKTQYYIAAYQSPSTLINRRNEVLIPVQKCS